MLRNVRMFQDLKQGNSHTALHCTDLALLTADEDEFDKAHSSKAAPNV
jgi:hypothetical protein